MALVLADRVRDTTTTTGTGTVTLSGTAPTGYQTFGATIGNGNTTYYTINAGSQWEVGIGTYSSTGPTLARTTVLASSNSGSLVDFSTGTKDVFVTYPAEKSVNQDASGNVGIGTTSPGVLLDVFSTAGPIIKNRSSTVNTTLRGFEIQTVNDIHASFKAEPSSGELRIASGFSTWGGYQTFYTNGSERMRITSAGDVGIGTTSPNSAGVNRAITVNGTSNSIVEVNYGGTRGAYLFSNASGTVLSSVQNLRLQLNTNDTPRVTIASSGNVGIGTDTPSEKLEVAGNLKITGSNLSIAPSTGTSAAYVLNTNTSGNLFCAIDSSTGAAFGAGNYARVLYSSGAYPLAFFTNDAERMRIIGSGYVGIGTTAPNGELQVKTAGGQWRIETNGAGTKMVGVNAADTGEAIITMQGSPITFFSNGSERARIDSSGNLGVGTSAPKTRLQATAGGFLNAPVLGSATGAPLYVSNSDTSYGLVAGVNNATGHVWLQAQRTDGTATAYNLTLNEAGGNVLVGTTSRGHNSGVNSFDLDIQDAALYVTHSNGTPSGYYFASFGYQTTSIGNITQNGTTGVLYNTSSDVRLKENVADADDAASLIDAIQVRKFDWKADGSHQRYGFVAQELVTVAPEAVSQPADPDDMMGVDYSKLVPMLVKEIQSLRARVAQLEGN